MKFYHVIDYKRNSGITIVAEVVDPPADANVTVPFYTKDGVLPNLVECAVSYCAPVESTFSRPKGRMIAQSRLSSQKELPPFKRFSFFTTNQNGLKAQILSCLNGTLNLGWAKSLVNRELERLHTIQLQKALDADTEETSA
jgi:hypothetical protein